MKTTQEQRKQKAVELMKMMEIYKPYIDGFEQEGWPYRIDNFRIDYKELKTPKK